MKVFKKKEAKKTCSCKGDCPPEAMQNVEQSENGIKILGSGCAKCIALEKAAQRAVAELGLAYRIQHVSDIIQIARYGVMSTPALVFNGKVVSYGKVLTVEDVKRILKTEE